MNENKTRDLALNVGLSREDCDVEEVYEFLRLLKRTKKLTPHDDDCVQNNECRMVVKNSKKEHFIHVFKKRLRSVHESALECERMVEVLVQFFKFILK